MIESLCVKCGEESEHEVDGAGEAIVECKSCGTGYDAIAYDVRSFSARRNTETGINAYRIGVGRPNGQTSNVTFDSPDEIVVQTGSQISISYYAGLPKYLLDRSVRRFWDVQKGTGCGAVLLLGCGGRASCSGCGPAAHGRLAVPLDLVRGRCLTEQVVGTRPSAGGAVVRIEESAAIKRETAAADAPGQFVA